MIRVSRGFLSLAARQSMLPTKRWRRRRDDLEGWYLQLCEARPGLRLGGELVVQLLEGALGVAVLGNGDEPGALIGWHRRRGRGRGRAGGAETGRRALDLAARNEVTVAISGASGVDLLFHEFELGKMLSLLARRPAASLRFLSSRLMSSSFDGHVPLVLTPRQLQEISPSSNVAVLDASWHMPNSPRKAREEFAKKRIPGAQYLDLDEVASSHELGLKHMMPSPDVFAQACGTRSPV